MDSLESVISTLTAFSLDKALRLIGAIVILIIGFKFIKFIGKLLIKGKLFNLLDLTVQHFIKIIVDYTLKILLIITVASIIGVPMTSMLAVLGSVGLAIGLALQGSLSNIAGGFIIFIFKPIAVGDFIIAGDNSGTVQDINLFYTIILTVDNKRTHIPNSLISNQTITDVSAMPTRRVDLKFSAAYSSDIDKVKNILINTASEHLLVFKDPTPVVYLAEHGDSALLFFLRVWCNNTDYWAVYYNLIENVKKEFDKNQIEIPFPQLDVHLDKNI